MTPVRLPGGGWFTSSRWASQILRLFGCRQRLGRVKIRWRLTIDATEKNALTSWANNCANVTISVTYAY